MKNKLKELIEQLYIEYANGTHESGQSWESAIAKIGEKTVLQKVATLRKSGVSYETLEAFEHANPFISDDLTTEEDDELRERAADMLDGWNPSFL